MHLGRRILFILLLVQPNTLKGVQKGFLYLHPTGVSTKYLYKSIKISALNFQSCQCQILICDIAVLPGLSESFPTTPFLIAHLVRARCPAPVLALAVGALPMGQGNAPMPLAMANGL